MSPKRPRVHPPYRTKYRLSNSAEYDQALIKRGSITFWISSSVIKKWSAKPSGKCGGQAKLSNLAIKTALTLGLVFRLPLRQTEGFASSIFELMGLHLDVPDHTTLSRRSGRMKVKLHTRKASGPIDLMAPSISSSTARVCPLLAKVNGLLPNTAKEVDRAGRSFTLVLITLAISLRRS